MQSYMIKARTLDSAYSICEGRSEASNAQVAIKRWMDWAVRVKLMPRTGKGKGFILEVRREK